MATAYPLDPPPPVSETNPLVGLETMVLRVWLENSSRLRKAHENPAARLAVENAVRRAVHDAIEQELDLKSQGLTQEQARELTRPAMWKPARWPQPAVGEQ